ncbi:MAG: metal ABC transporter substrate-binding protein [Elusimicrobia bacterium]|nr:metal ABC transporter substrate-binding protein [Elusimicrobiota bacterium]
MIFAAALLAALAAPAHAAKLKVLATIPELADIASQIGGDDVDVQGSLARGTEDIHQVVMRPSFVTRLNRADAVIYLGLTVEHSFLPGLLDAAVNPKMRTDPIRECVGPGCIDVSEGVQILEKPETLSRAEGELHPYGNPHYNLGPQNGPQIARNIAAGFSRIDPAHAADYQKNLKAFLAEMDPKIAEWRKWVASLKGVKAISYHKDVAYLGKFTGLDFIDTVEFKPGVPPTPTHLERLVEEMKAQNVKLIVREQHFETKTVEWLAEQTGAKIAVIGVMANSLPDTKTWVKLQEKNLKNIVTAVTGKEPS